jgi:hypothetical protein
LDPKRDSDISPRRARHSPTARLAGRAALAVALTAGAVTAAFAANWELNPGAGGGACRLISAMQPVNDGYQEVQAQIVLEGRAVVVKSDSVLDDGFADIGIAVANHPFIPIDRIQDRKLAVFEKQYEKIVQLFKEGREVRVQMRFWPTWPATGTHSATFSLMGFTKAYGEAARCR